MSVALYEYSPHYDPRSRSVSSVMCSSLLTAAQPMTGAIEHSVLNVVAYAAYMRELRELWHELVRRAEAPAAARAFLMRKLHSLRPQP